MLNIVGQTNLRQHIDTLTGEAMTLPHFIIIEGEKGAGKHTLVRYIQSKVDWPIYEAPDLKIDTVRQLIDDSTKISSPRIYLFKQGENMGSSAQNAMLKFAEEPNPNTYIIMTCNSLNVLPTIISRATVFSMEPYTKEQLAEFGEGDLLLDVCTNPGQVIGMQMVNYKSMYEFCLKIINNIGKASVANVFKISHSVDDEDVMRYPIDLFFNMLIYALNEKLRNRENVYVVSKMFSIVYQYKQQLGVNGVNKKNVLDAMFLKLWEACR